MNKESTVRSPVDVDVDPVMLVMPDDDDLDVFDDEGCDDKGTTSKKKASHPKRPFPEPEQLQAITSILLLNTGIITNTTKPKLDKATRNKKDKHNMSVHPKASFGSKYVPFEAYRVFVDEKTEKIVDGRNSPPGSTLVDYILVKNVAGGGTTFLMTEEQFKAFLKVYGPITLRELFPATVRASFSYGLKSQAVKFMLLVLVGRIDSFVFINKGHVTKMLDSEEFSNIRNAANEIWEAAVSEYVVHEMERPIAASPERTSAEGPFETGTGIPIATSTTGLEPTGSSTAMQMGHTITSTPTIVTRPLTDNTNNTINSAALKRTTAFSEPMCSDIVELVILVASMDTDDNNSNTEAIQTNTDNSGLLLQVKALFDELKTCRGMTAKLADLVASVDDDNHNVPAMDHSVLLSRVATLFEELENFRCTIVQLSNLVTPIIGRNTGTTALAALQPQVIALVLEYHQLNEKIEHSRDMIAQLEAAGANSPELLQEQQLVEDMQVAFSGLDIKLQAALAKTLTRCSDSRRCKVNWRKLVARLCIGRKKARQIHWRKLLCSSKLKTPIKRLSSCNPLRPQRLTLNCSSKVSL